MNALGQGEPVLARQADIEDHQVQVLVLHFFVKGFS